MLKIITEKVLFWMLLDLHHFIGWFLPSIGQIWICITSALAVRIIRQC